MHRIKTSSVRRGVTRPERIAAEGGSNIDSIPAIDLRRMKPLKKVLRAGSRRSWLQQ